MGVSNALNVIKGAPFVTLANVIRKQIIMNHKHRKIDFMASWGLKNQMLFPFAVSTGGIKLLSLNFCGIELIKAKRTKRKKWKLTG